MVRYAPKNATAIKHLSKAAKITNDIFGIISKSVKPGAREIEIAQNIENIISRKGLKRSFRTIVASGPNAAKPHAKITKRRIKKNDVVILDFGVIYKGYHSDMTRTLLIGKMDSKMRKLYRTVKTTQEKAIKRVKAGLKISDFVKGIHDCMRKEGFGKYILHGLGHGIGTRIHQPPKLSEKNRTKLKKNTVVTIEPGLYINHKGGVRIEDMVWISKNRPRVLTR